MNSSPHSGGGYSQAQKEDGKSANVICNKSKQFGGANLPIKSS